MEEQVANPGPFGFLPRDPAELHAFLAAREIGSMVYYPVPLHLQKLYEGLGLRAGSLPNAEQAAREVLSLPIYPELTEAQQAEVATAIGAFYAGTK